MQRIIVGIDEAGRGPLAGPVVAAAFCMVGKPKLRAIGNFDSKKLTPRWREDVYKILTSHPQIVWAVGRVSEKQIDKINILQATRLAMKKAVLSLERKLLKIDLCEDRLSTSAQLVIDGNMLLDLPIRQTAVIKADAAVWQCMAASIIAKVTRDRLMLGYHKKYPLYGFDQHKGYGTKIHFEMLKKYGPCPIHRMSFTPCRRK